MGYLITQQGTERPVNGSRTNERGGPYLVLTIFAASALIFCLCSVRIPNSKSKFCTWSALAQEQQQSRDCQSHRLLLDANGSLEADKNTLLKFKNLLKTENPFKDKLYENWHETDPSPCNWSRITCRFVDGSARVTGIDFQGCGLQSQFFKEFSALSALSILSLGENQFRGEISPDLGNCRSLTILNLSSNFLVGTPDFTGLTKLRTLDLSGNRLDGRILSIIPNPCDNLSTLNLSLNNFTGGIEESIRHCSSLKVVDLSENRFNGTLWEGLGNMEEALLCCNNISGSLAFPDPCKLRKLDLSTNNLTGPIPESISNCRELLLLDLSENHLFGEIPPQISFLQNLDTLVLRNDNLSRNIPLNLTQCPNLKFLDLSGNYFGGGIQPIFGELKQIQFLILHNNYYEATIPDGILELPSLLSLDLSFNKLSGPLPVALGSMKSIRYLILASNNFDESIPPELGQLLQLQILDLSLNSLTGSLPPSLGNLTSLLWLMVEKNSLTGPIPPELGNCKSLLWLNLAYNNLSGPLPETLSNIGNNPNDTFNYNKKHLQPFPRQSGACLPLKRWVPDNYPPSQFVYLILNRKSCKHFWEYLLKGTAIFPICPRGEQGDLYIISGYLQLTGNNLSGPIPKSIGGLKFFSLFQLALNKFEGQLPEEIADIPLRGLNVSSNNLSGTIPSSIGEIRCLQNLDLSYNNFSGQIPNSLVNLHDLTRFNVSYNPLLTGSALSQGQFGTFDETSYMGDDFLCFEHLPNMRSNMTNLRPCKNSRPPPSPTKPRERSRGRSLRNLVMAISILASATILLCGFLTFYISAKRVPPYNTFDSMPEYEDGDGGCALVKEKKSESSSSSSMHFFRGKHFTYADILLATSNFSETYVIGSGGFGTVYKGTLKDGSMIAVKKLQQKGPQGEREFIAEMETLGSHEFHENLVPLQGCCLFGGEKLLVYDFMSNGSLEDWLHEKAGGCKQLGWSTRYKIALGTAKGLKFLHHDCSPVVVHRDMKASNILLDAEFKPHLTDFGLARFVDVAETHVSTVVAGTLGYVPPEYSQSWRATTKGDVYSYGVVLLELATGKRPISVSDSYSESESINNLVEWVSMLISRGRAAEALDPALMLEEVHYKCQLMRFLHLGYFCTNGSPDRRPSMEQVVAKLESLTLI